MGVQTQLDRLVGAKDSLKTSISKKGVSVPASVKMDGLSAYVDNIKQLDTSDATATASDIAKGKTAYIKGAKVIGTYEPTPGYAITSTDNTDGSQNLAITDADTGGSSEPTYHIEVTNDTYQSIIIDSEYIGELNGRTFHSGDVYKTSDTFSAIDILRNITITLSVNGESFDTDLQVNFVLNDAGDTISLWVTPM